jgi:hypothetical protein
VSSSLAVLVALGVCVAGCASDDHAPAASPSQKPGRAFDASLALPAEDARSAPDARMPAAALLPDAGSARVATARPDAASPGQAPRPTRLVLDFTTVTQKGRFAPVNGGVAWVADAQGKWVHTFDIWISFAASSAIAVYTAAGGPLYSRSDALFGVQPPADVITTATLPRHGPHVGESWDLKQASGNEVPDDSYKIVIEVAEEKPEHLYEFSFTKGGQPAQWIEADDRGLKDVKIRLE